MDPRVWSADVEASRNDEQRMRDEAMPMFSMLFSQLDDGLMTCYEFTVAVNVAFGTAEERVFGRVLHDD